MKIGKENTSYMRKAYIHSYHASCALGNKVESIRSSLLNNQSGLEPQRFNFEERVQFSVGKINDNEFLFKKKDTHFLEKLSVHYIRKSTATSGISLQDKKTRLLLSTTKGNINGLPNNIVQASLTNTIRYIKEELNAYHTPLLISNACISGVLAVNYAADLIKISKYDHVVICAVDLLTDFVVSGFNTFKAISNIPCKPYDANRQGISLGEACAVAVVSHKKSKIQIIGGASSNDANHISGPSRDGSGLALAVKKTIHYSTLTIKDIDAINAHGTATSFNDLMESKAFESLKMHNIPLNSLKGYFGHTLGAAGLLEIIMCTIMMENQTVLGTLFLEDLDENIHLNVSAENRNGSIKTLLKTASGFGGCNAATILKYE